MNCDEVYILTADKGRRIIGVFSTSEHAEQFANDEELDEWDVQQRYVDALLDTDT